MVSSKYYSSSSTRRQPTVNWKCQKLNRFNVTFGFIYLFNGISTPYGLVNTKIWLIYKCSISTIPLIRTLYCGVLSKEVSSTIFKVFSMTQAGIEPRSPGPLSNTLPTRSIILSKHLQVTILNTNGIKYSCLTENFFKQIYLMHRWDPNK